MSAGLKAAGHGVVTVDQPESHDVMVRIDREPGVMQAAGDPGPTATQRHSDGHERNSIITPCHAVRGASRAIRYSCATGPGGSGYEIAAGASRIAGTVRRTSGWMPEFAEWTSFVRDELEGTLELSRGEGSIILRATDAQGGQHEVMRPYTIELSEHQYGNLPGR